MSASVWKCTCHYNFEMLMCTIFILTIIVQFEMDIQYIMIWKAWYRGCAIQSGLEDTEKTHLKDTENKAHSLLFK